MNFDFSALNFETIDSNINAYPDMFLNQNGVTFTKKCLRTWVIPPLFCVCWMRKQEYLRSVPARATSRRASSSPSQEANRKVLLRFPTRICLTRFALSPARTGFPASVTGCAGSGLPMQKPCALTLMKGYRRTFALLRRTMMQNNP